VTVADFAKRGGEQANTRGRSGMAKGLCGPGEQDGFNARASNSIFVALRELTQSNDEHDMGYV